MSPELEVEQSKNSTKQHLANKENNIRQNCERKRERRTRWTGVNWENSVAREQKKKEGGGGGVKEREGERVREKEFTI